MKTENYLHPLRVQPYESYLPSAFDNSLSILEKMNKVIYQMNKVGVVTNGIIEQWNDLIEWIQGNGLEDVVDRLINEKIADGTFNDLFATVVGDLNDLYTIDKTTVVSAINEVFNHVTNLIDFDNTLVEMIDGIKSSIGELVVLETTDKTSIVNAINETLTIARTALKSNEIIIDSTGYGVVSGCEISQLLYPGTAVSFGKTGVPNIIHTYDGNRLILENSTVPITVNTTSQTYYALVYLDTQNQLQVKYATSSNTKPSVEANTIPLAYVELKPNDNVFDNSDISDVRYIKGLGFLKTPNKESLVMAINNVFNDLTFIKNSIGDLNNLITDDKTTIVNAINSLSLSFENDIGDLYDEFISKIGNLSELKTDDKTSLVQSVNELYDDVEILNDIVLTTGGYVTYVKAFGAVGDGVAIDTIAIQSAINAVANVGGGEVVFPYGTYIIDKPIWLAENVTLSGLNGAVVKLKDNCTPKPFSLFVYENSNAIGRNIHIKDLTIDGNRINNVDHGNPNMEGNQDKYFVGSLLALINLTNVSGFSITNCQLINSFGSGVWVNDCELGLISNNIISDYRSVGIAVRNNTATNLIVSNGIQITSNKISGGVVGIHNIFGVIRCIVSGNECFNNRDINRFPSWAYGGTYPNVYPLDSRFNRPSSPAYISPSFEGDGAGVEFTGYYTSDLAFRNDLSNISSNICFDNMVGIRIEEETSYISITGNTCSANDQAGIFIFSSSFITVTGNNVVNNKGDGIRVQQLLTRAIAEQVLITGNTCTLNDLYGLAMYGVRGFTVTGNNFSRNNTGDYTQGGGIGLYGVESRGTSYGVISSNLFVNYDGRENYGIYTNDSGMNSENLIDANVFQNYKISALNLSPQHNIIRNNKGFKTSGAGIVTLDPTLNSVVVTHGLNITPTLENITLSTSGDVNSVNTLFVNNITPTTFTIEYDTGDVTDANVSVNWLVSEDN